MTGERTAGQRRDRFHGRVSERARECEHPGCEAAGEFRAPRRGPDAPGEEALADRWRWFCLDHVRAFNASYNYFAGMSPDEIERAQRVYAGWERETRAFASAGDPRPAWERVDDPADLLGARFGKAATRPAATVDGRPLSPDDHKALKVLGLTVEARLADVRRAYAEKVRLFHPDRNGGDRSHERALQAVISAYTHLRKAPAFS